MAVIGESSLDMRSQDSAQAADAQLLMLCLTTALAVLLVLVGGLFAGLTLALMGQDEVHLQVLRISGTDRERKDAVKVLRLLRCGKHWILVTLLISNVITNEALPVVLDHWLSSGWPTVLTATVLVLAFGEIIPQSVGAKHGLRVGACSATSLQILMYLLSPIAYPIALLLDWMLGKQEGPVMRKSRLKTLISLQKSLEADEVTLVSAALDMKERWISSVMTPLSNTYVLGADERLNDLLRHKLWTAGFNQIPVHAPGDATKFIGVLSTKDLIIDPVGEVQRVKDLNLAPLPVVSPDLNCLDMLKFFRDEEKRMVLVTECGAINSRALGIITRRNIIDNLVKE